MPRITKKNQLFIEAFCGQANGNASEAARLAGYKWAGPVSSKLYKNLKTEIEKRLLELKEKAILKPEEVLEAMSEIARDKTHKDRLRALESLAKINGQLNERLNIALNRVDLIRQIEETIQGIVVEKKRNTSNSIVDN